MRKIAIIGAGGWGTALAILLGNEIEKSQRKLDVYLWIRREELAQKIAQNRINSEYLPNVKIPLAVNINSSIKDIANEAEIIIVAVPSQYVRQTVREMKPFIDKNAIICSASKGIELRTFKRMSEVIYEEAGIAKRNIAVLSGPSHAEEVGVGKATTVVSASISEATAGQVQEILSTQLFRVYTSRDIKGVEYGGALKNIIAIGAGVCDGLKKKGEATSIGDNAKASLLTRGIEEMARLGISLGSNKTTFYGLSGWGDLLVTSYSSYGRNRLVGECLAMGMTLDEIKKEKLHGMVPEGVETTKAIYELSKTINVEMPITEQIYHILYEGKDIESAVYDLMTRSLKPEHGYYIKGIPKRVKLAFRK
jgi:glycerol-3-phosphate dehydrogenase (NAD(P)+)